LTVFTELTILVVLATALAFVMRYLRQPLIVGYILTGLIGGPIFLDVIKSEEVLNLFSEIGIAFLLFIVGLNLTPQAIKTFGKVALLTGLGQVIFTFFIGWIITTALGFGFAESMYLSIGLAFSSTIIILKLLSDKGDLEKLYGKISIGFLLVQDFVAVLILFFVPVFSVPDNSPMIVAVSIIKGLTILIVVYLIAYFLFKRINRFVAKSQELLFLFAIAWGLGLAGMFRAVGFSLESGALIAGATLSILPSHDEIHSRLKPLRDFFIVLFFVLLGARMVISGTEGIFGNAILLSLFVLIGNPLILLIIMGLLGYRKKTSFQTGLTVAQISEFSLIVIVLGVSYGHIGQEILSLATLVGLITILISTYMITYSERLFSFLSPILSIFEKRNTQEMELTVSNPELVLFGHNRIGYDFLRTFQSMKRPYLLIDYDPQVIEKMQQSNVPAEYGDASDIEFLRLMNFSKIKLAVSTIPDYETNRLILSHVKSKRRGVIVVAVANTVADTESLYGQGVDYVIMPHLLGAQYAAKTVQDLQFDRKKFASLRQRHIKYLASRGYKQ